MSIKTDFLCLKFFKSTLKTLRDQQKSKQKISCSCSLSPALAKSPKKCRVILPSEVLNRRKNLQFTNRISEVIPRFYLKFEVLSIILVSFHRTQTNNLVQVNFERFLFLKIDFSLKIMM